MKMWLIKLKYFSLKLFEYIKYCWKALLLLLLVFATFSFLRKKKKNQDENDITKILTDRLIEHNKTISRLNELQKQEEETRIKIEDKYQKHLEQVKEQYQQKSETLSKKQEKELKQIVEKLS